MNLADLKSTIESSTANGILPLTDSMLPPGDLPSFIKALPAGKLTLKITDIVFAEASQYLVRGILQENWTLKDFQQKQLSNVNVAIQFTQFSPADPVLGTMRIERCDLSIAPGIDLTLSGMLVNGGLLYLEYAATMANPVPIASFLGFTGSDLTAYIPPVPIFSSGSVSAFNLSFGFAQDSSSSMQFAASCNADWQITDKISIKRTGLSFSITNEITANQKKLTSFNGQIYGTITIGQDFDIVVHLQDNSQLELEVKPSNGNVLPLLSDVAGFAGGDSLKQTVQSGLNDLGIDSISIDDVKIGFNYSTRTLAYIAMRSHIILNGIQINIFTRLPDFEFGGSLAPGSTISLKSIIQNYFSASDSFPEIDITTLGLIAHPSINLYSLVADVTDDWQFDLGQGKTLAISEVNLNLIKSAGDISGNIQGIINIAGLDINLSAANTKAGNTSSWVFTGASAVNQPIPIGQLAADLTKLFNLSLPQSIADTTLSNIGISFDTLSGNFTFACDGAIPFSNGNVIIHLNIAVTHVQGNYSRKIDGHLTVGGNDFAFSLSDDDTVLTFLATFQQKGSSINVQAAVSALSSDIAALIPSDFTLAINNAEIAIYKNATGTGYLLGLGLGLSADLTNIPLIGAELSDSALLLEDVQLYFASQDFSKDEVAGFGSSLLPANGMTRGFLVNSDLTVGGNKYGIQLPVASTGSSAASSTTPASPAVPSAATSASAPVKWWPLQRSIGPVTFERIGVKYKDGVLWFMLDVTLSSGGLTLSLDGLAAGSPLNNFDLRFHLDGIGIDYDNGPVNIGGALLSVTPDPSTGATFQYDGEVIIQTEAMTLAAVGSYSNPGGEASLFVFAEADKEFGGPPYFFVTGLSAGFGYNSKVNLPSVSNVVNFPLVAGLQGQTDPLQVLNILEGRQGGTTWVQAQLANNWLAIGLQFTSFELINSRALLMAEFGQEFELALLGISKVQLPQDAATKYAYVEMGLEARFVPDEGFCGVSAVISKNSYVITPDCKLTGGFALYSWFGSSEYAGDFVITAGGYHPAFIKPAWYPDVDRLGFNWHVSDNVTISGEAYFALTPSCVMGGGGLQVLFHDGDLKAWLTAYADFLIYWKPFHFQVGIGVSIGVSYKVDFLFVSKTFSVELGASLAIWGPPTGGKVHIDWYIISFTVHFGEDETSGQGNLVWSDFQTLLPAEQDICKINVGNGLQATATDSMQTDGTKRWLVRSDEFEFTTQCAVPATSLQTAAPNEVATLRSGASDPASLLNIRPMGKQGVNSTHLVTITDPQNQVIDLDQKGWSVEVVEGSVPESLWGTPLDGPPPPSANVIAGKNSGLKITAPAAKQGPTPGPVNMESDLSYEPLEPEGILSLSVILPADISVPQYSDSTITTIGSTIAGDSAKQKRSSLFQVLSTAGIYNGSNDSMDLLAADIGNVYEDEPLIAS